MLGGWKTQDLFLVLLVALVESLCCRHIFIAVFMFYNVAGLNFIVHWNLNSLGQENAATGKENTT